MPLGHCFVTGISNLKVERWAEHSSPAHYSKVILASRLVIDAVEINLFSWFMVENVLIAKRPYAVSGLVLKGENYILIHAWHLERNFGRTRTRP